MSGNSSDSDLSLLTRISRKLSKLVDDGTTNNYGEWKIESEILFLGRALLEYVSGARSQPLNIPTLREPTTHKGIDEETGIERVIITRGNAKEHKRKKKAAKPWLKKNNAALSKIFQAFLAPNKFISLRAFDMHLPHGKRYVLTTNPKIPPSQISKEVTFNLIVVCQIWTSGNGSLKSAIAITLCLT
jgi:hypothetical protein